MPCNKALKISPGKNVTSGYNRAYLELTEVLHLEQCAINLRDKLLIHLLYHLGCRISEVLALTEDDIDLTQGIVTIIHLKRRLQLSCPECHTRLSISHIFCPKCGVKVEQAVTGAKKHQRRRTLPLDKAGLRMLREYIHRRGPVLRNGKRMIFGINRHRAWQIIRECADRAGLPGLVNTETGKYHGVSPHRLRDAFAVHAVKVNDSGDGLRMLQEHLGHASFNTTARYRKVAGEELREWYEKLWQQNPEE